MNNKFINGTSRSPKNLVRGNSTTFNFGTFSGITVIFMLFAYIIVQNSTSGDGFSGNLTLDGVLSLISIVISSIMVGFSVGSSTLQFTSALFWVFQYTFFGITAYSYSKDTQPLYLARGVSANGFHQAHILVLISGFFVAVTQIVCHVKRHKGGTSDVLPVEIDIPILLRKLRTLTYVYLLLAIPILAYLGGFTYLFRKGAQAFGYDNGSNPLLVIAESIFLVVPVVVTCSLLTLKSFNHVKVNRLWLYGSLIWLLIISNPLAHARQSVLFTALPIAYIAMKRSRRFGIILIYIIPFAMLYLANVVDRSNGSVRLNFSIAVTSRLGDLDAFAQLSNGIDKVSLGIFPLMHQIIGSIFFFIPRSLWSAKPFDTGVVIGQQSNLLFSNLSAPWILEAYVNARLIGVIIVSIWIGYTLFNIDMSAKPKLYSYLIGAITSGSLFILLRGSLLQATGRTLFCFLAVFLLFRNVTINPQAPKIEGVKANQTH